MWTRLGPKKDILISKGVLLLEVELQKCTGQQRVLYSVKLCIGMHVALAQFHSQSPEQPGNEFKLNKLGLILGLRLS